MGLKHKAIHAMLANPELAPFEVIETPCQRQDWILIDHLITIHKVKKSDYIEDDPQASIVNIARTLANVYISENAGGHCVVLVKDGTQAQKPAVRERRLNRVPAPHIDFCRRNLHAIEYTMMKMLADVGMKDMLFLVTGSKGKLCEEVEEEEEEEDEEDSQLEETPHDNLVSFHQEYLDNPKDQKRVECQPQRTPSYECGSIQRPVRARGVFVTTFADPSTPHVSVLRDACLQCTSTEADTLLVELANVLNGSVTVCTGDSDVVAVMTACGREGVTVRLENQSYHEHQAMHTSAFGELLFAVPEVCNPGRLFKELVSSADRFRVMCDITTEDEHLLQTTKMQHEAFEAILDERGDVNCKIEMARNLYLGGIRGSLYCAFMTRFFESNDQRLAGLKMIAEGRVHKNMVCYIFDTLYPASDKSRTSNDSNVDNPASFTGGKRKISCVHEQDVPELCLDDDEDDVDNKVVISRAEKGVSDSLKRLNSAYMRGVVPRGSHGRFLRLTQAGRHIYLRMKGDLLRDEKERRERLFFMVLCGTDYNMVPIGLGIKRLMTGVITNSKSFSSWCQELQRLLWGACDVPSQACDYHNMGLRLAYLTKVPATTRSKYWTRANCELLLKTMKYVCELWAMKRPRPGPDYGFSVLNGMVRFNYGHSLCVDAAV